MGTPEAREWLVKHKLKGEFGYTSEQAKYELDNHADDVLVSLKIWSLVAERQKSDAEIEQKRQQFNQSSRGNVR